MNLPTVDWATLDELVVRLGAIRDGGDAYIAPEDRQRYYLALRDFIVVDEAIERELQFVLNDTSTTLSPAAHKRLERTT